jgi:hypothetical protein
MAENSFFLLLNYPYFQTAVIFNSLPLYTKCQRIMQIYGITFKKVMKTNYCK